MDPATVSLISAITALVASILGPIVTLIVARTQFSASAISANRHRRIESFRDTLAELTSQIAISVIAFTDRKPGWKDAADAAAADPANLKRFERIVYLYWKLRLLVDTTHPEQEQLCKAIEALLESLRKFELTPPLTRAAMENITQLSQKILKNEWERVKRGT